MDGSERRELRRDMHGIERRSIVRDGETITYEVKGEGPPLLLAHGLLGDGRFWDAIAPSFTATRRVIVPDLRGHRGTPATGPFSLWESADDVRAILDAEAIDRTPWVGFSMGAMIGMRLALRAPGRLSGLCLLSTSAGAETWFSRLEKLALARIVTRFGPLRIFEPKTLRLMFARSFRTDRANADVIAATMNQLRGHGRDLGHAIAATFGRPSIADLLGAVGVPAVVAIGEEDVLAPPTYSEELAAGLGAELTRFPGVGHMLPLERPEETRALIATFLERLASGQLSGDSGGSGAAAPAPVR